MYLRCDAPISAAISVLVLACASCSRPAPLTASSATPTNERFTSEATTAQIAAGQGNSEPGGKFANVNGRRLWYRMAGKGAPLFIVPGGPGLSHTYLYPGLERLANSFQVVFFDAFGRGQSDRAPNPSEYSFNGDVEDLEGLRRALGFDRLAVYGFSYGGMVAQAYALRYPLRVSKLVLAHTLHSGEMWQSNVDNSNTEVRNQFPEIWEELQQLRKKGADLCDAEYQKASGPLPLNLVAFYDPSNLHLQFDLNFDVYCRIAGRDPMAVGGDLASLDFRRQLREIKIPTLVLAGRFDRQAMPRYSLQYRTLMPQADFVMFERSGHYSYIEEPERHDAVVRTFLEK